MPNYAESRDRRHFVLPSKISIPK